MKNNITYQIYLYNAYDRESKTLSILDEELTTAIEGGFNADSFIENCLQFIQTNPVEILEILDFKQDLPYQEILSGLFSSSIAFNKIQSIRSGLNDEIITWFVPLIQQNQQLHKELLSFDFSENPTITVKGVETLVNKLEPKIKLLVLDDNNLGDEIADILALSSSLQELSLNNSKITARGIKNVGTLRGLKKLYLGNNFIMGCDHLAPGLILEPFSIQYQFNKDCGPNLKFICNGKQLLVSLHYEIEPLFNFYLSKLVSLDLSRNRVNLFNVIEAYAPNSLILDRLKHVSKLSSLTSLNLGGRFFRSEVATHLLSTLSNLQSLTLVSDKCPVFPECSLPKLTLLKVGYPQFMDELDPVSAELVQFPTTLTSLSLRNDRGFNNTLQWPIWDRFGENIQKITKLSSLTFLNLSGRLLRNEFLPDCLPKLSSLRKLKLSLIRKSSNETTLPTIQCLSLLTGLTSLDLSGSEGSFDNEESIDYLLKLTLLTSLTLKRCCITDQSALKLALNTKLKLLNLRYNWITHETINILYAGNPLKLVQYWNLKQIVSMQGKVQEENDLIVEPKATAEKPAKKRKGLDGIINPQQGMEKRPQDEKLSLKIIKPPPPLLILSLFACRHFITLGSRDRKKKWMIDPQKLPETIVDMIEQHVERQIIL